MKKKLLTVAMLLLHSYLIIGMQVTTKITPQETVTTNNAYIYYLQQCSKKNAKQERKLRKNINKSTSETYRANIQSTQDALAKLSLKLDVVELKHRNKIQKNLNVSGDDWAQFLFIVSKLQDLENKSKHLPRSNTVHDKKIPKCFKSIIKASLVKNGINPKRINILLDDNTTGVSSPCPECTVTQQLCNTIFYKKVIPCNSGTIILSHVNIPFNNQITFATLWTHAIDQKKILFYHALLELCSAFKITREELFNNKYCKKYKNIVLPIAVLTLALKSQKNAYDLHILFSTNGINYGDITAISVYKHISKIKRHWDYLEWLQNYRSLYTGLTLKKDPTQEPTTLEELTFWKKNNDNPLCLPVRCNTASSFNPFDVLHTQSFSKEYSGQQDKLMYKLFMAHLNNLPVYEHENAISIISECHFLLKKLNSDEYSFTSLVEKYGKKSVKKAIKMANSYAARKTKKPILSLKFYL